MRVVFLAVFICLLSIRSVFANSMPPGTVILAHGADDALLIWDATPDVALVVKHFKGLEAKEKLERDALYALSSSLSKIPTAKTIALRTIYQRTGEVSAVYGTPVFAGVERYALVKMDARDANSDRDKWRELDDKAPIPTWITYILIGKLPAS